MNELPPLFRKLGLRQRRAMLVLNAPASFEVALAALHGVEVKRQVAGPAEFAIAFATTCAERDAASAALAQACPGDALVWLAYPKASSRRYRAEFTRDSGWAVLGAAGFEPVSQVAVDDDWSALRFRRVAFIKTLKRNPDGAISAEGRRKALAGRAGPG